MKHVNKTHGTLLTLTKDAHSCDLAKFSLTSSGFYSKCPNSKRFNSKRVNFKRSKSNYRANCDSKANKPNDRRKPYDKSKPHFKQKKNTHDKAYNVVLEDDSNQRDELTDFDEHNFNSSDSDANAQLVSNVIPID